MPVSAPDFSRLFDARRLGPDDPDRERLRRAAERGDVERLRRGIYRDKLSPLEKLPTEERAAEARARFLELAVAAGLTRRGRIVFAGATAQRIHGFPNLGGAGSTVELLEPMGSKRRNAFGITVHTDEFREEDLEPWGEFFVTSTARTLADLAKWATRAQAVAALDFAFNSDRSAPGQRATKPEVEAALAASVAVRNRAAAAATIAFACTQSGSVGESVSRVLMDDFGFPAPLLQVRHPAPPGKGKWFFTDFEWPEFGLIGEFDGRTKFLKPEYLAGGTASQAVIAEKFREDWLRAAGFRVVRWSWDFLIEPSLLRAVLVAQGLPARRIRRGLSRPW
jgi:hypothetical protein